MGPITRENTYTYTHAPGGFHPHPLLWCKQASKFRSRSTDDERNGRLVCVFRLFPGMWKDLDGWMDGKQDISIYLSIYSLALSHGWMLISFLFLTPLPACYTTHAWSYPRRYLSIWTSRDKASYMDRSHRQMRNEKLE